MRLRAAKNEYQKKIMPHDAITVAISTEELMMKTELNQSFNAYCGAL